MCALLATDASLQVHNPGSTRGQPLVDENAKHHPRVNSSLKVHHDMRRFTRQTVRHVHHFLQGNPVFQLGWEKGRVQKKLGTI